MSFRIFISCLISIVSFVAYSQMQATFSTTVNTRCEGNGCDWNGPSILINEMMMSPTNYDGSLWEPNCNANSRCGEWIELYNPDICRPVDVSCYHLGNNAFDVSGNYGGGYTIPQGTIVPPAGFLVLRGENAPSVPSNLLVQNGGRTIEIVIQGSNTCIGGGSRLWFPNAGNWFAFYDASGVPQDAVSWGNSSNVSMNPCIAPATNCSGVTTLASYNSIPSNRKTYVYGTFPNSWGFSVRRIPDGGSWQTNVGSIPTMGTCNSICATLGTSTCDGSATVNVTGGTPPYTYQWDDSRMQITQTADSLCAGTYHVKVKDANNQFIVFTVVIQDFTPNVTFSTVTDVCEGNQIISFNNYSPVPTSAQTGVFSGTGVVNNTFDVGIAGVGTFPIQYAFTDENGCKDSVVSDITVHPLPNPSILGLNSSYCINQSPVSFTVMPAGGIIFLDGNILNNNILDIQTIGIGSHTLKYIASSAFGCIDSVEISIAIHDLPEVVAGNDTSICLGQSVLLTTSGAVSYVWDHNLGSGNNLTVSPLQTTIYTVIGTDAFGCSSTDQIQVIVKPLPTVTTSVPDSICLHDSTLIQAFGAVSYLWDNNLGNQSEYMVSPTVTTNYSVIGTGTNGCQNTAYVQIDVLPLPNVQLNASDFFLCIGDTFILKATGALSYSWNHDLGNGNTQSVTPSSSITYVVKGTDVNGCQNEDSVRIHVIKTIPTVDFNVTDSAGCSPFHTSIVEHSSKDVVNCFWKFSNGQQQEGCGTIDVTIYDTGCHDVTVRVVSDSGCYNQQTKLNAICVFPNPIADFTISPSSIQTNVDQQVVFTNNSLNGVTYFWSFGDSSMSNDFEPSHHFPSDYPYNYVIKLKVLSKDGCVDSTHQIFKVYEDLIYYVPNAFTPNGDENNNQFLPVFSQGFDLYNYHLQIYNRWGEVIFETSNVSIGWDGYLNGKICPVGTYVWKIDIKKRDAAESIHLKGHVNLIR